MSFWELPTVYIFPLLMTLVLFYHFTSNRITVTGISERPLESEAQEQIGYLIVICNTLQNPFEFVTSGKSVVFKKKKKFPAACSLQMAFDAVNATY